MDDMVLDECLVMGEWKACLSDGMLLRSFGNRVRGGRFGDGGREMVDGLVARMDRRSGMLMLGGGCRSLMNLHCELKLKVILEL